MSSSLFESNLELPEQSSNVATPATGQARLFIKDDQSVNVIFDDTTVVDLTQSGSSSLDALTDTNLSSLADGDLLKYVTPPGEWQNAQVDIDDLANVTIATPLSQQVLQYDGVDTWNNATLNLTTTLNGLTDVTITTEEQGDVLVRGGSGWINRPYNQAVMAYLADDSTPLVIQPTSGPSGGDHIIDLDLSDTIHESLGGGTLTNTVGGIQVFRTPDGVNDALGTLNGFLAIDGGSYNGNALFEVYLKNEALDTTPDTTIGAGDFLVWDGDPSSFTPNGNITFLHFSIPIFGADVAGAMQFYLVVHNQGLDPFAVTWRLAVDWHENQT